MQIPRNHTGLSLKFSKPSKKVLQKTAIGIKTIKAIRNQLPKKSLKALLDILITGAFSSLV